MLAPERATVARSLLRIPLKGRRHHPNSRIVHGSCPGQVGSKKTRLARASNSNTILAATSLVVIGHRLRVNPNLVRFGPPGSADHLIIPGGK
jgi:hypothetical protein